MKFFLLCLALITGSLCIAQNRYSNTDAYVLKLGPLTGYNVAIIAVTLTRPFPDKEMKARAIYTFIAHHVALDVKATKGGDSRNILPEQVMVNRKTTPLGYATLFQEMASIANIRCLTVDGFVKRSVEEINNPEDEINHTWNVVQLGQTPTEWYYVDVAKASGYTDRQMKNFTPRFTSEYFFAPRALFNLDHYPDNKAWQLGDGPKAKKDFYALPPIGNAAYETGASNFIPVTGFVKTKMKNPVAFSFSVGIEDITSVELSIGDEKKNPKPEPMNFNNNGGNISFSYQFKRDDTMPVRVLVNGKVVVEYLFEVRE